MFESALDARESVTGTVMLDCEEHLSAIISITYKAQGRFVRQDDTPDDRVLMTADTAPSTVSDLCDFLRDAAAPSAPGSAP
jgi:hypothetical protein